MNKKHLIYFLMLFFPLEFFGQDTLYYVNGSKQVVEVKGIKRRKIKYGSNSLDSNYKFVERELVALIKYNNGSVDTLPEGKKMMRFAMRANDDRIFGSNIYHNKKLTIDEQIVLLETAAVNFRNSELASLVKRAKRNYKHFKSSKNIGLYSLIFGGIAAVSGAALILNNPNRGLGGVLMLGGGGVALIGGGFALNSLALNFAKTHKLRKAKKLYNSLVLSSKDKK